jgi:hypothetical protein
VTLSNTGTAAASVTSMVETLPAGFGYVAGSTTGGITTDPAVAAGQLTWTGHSRYRPRAPSASISR